MARPTCCFQHVLESQLDDGTAFDPNSFTPEEIALPPVCNGR